MTQTPLKILITGFGAFPGVKDNPCAFLIEQLQHTDVTIVDNVEIHPHMLETAWQAAPAKLTKLYKQIEPDIALHFGYAAQAQGFCLEQFAHNTTIQALDFYGDLPAHHKVVPGSAARFETPFPVADIVTYLDASEFPAQSSTDAGHYLCNMISYLSAFMANHEKKRTVHTLFVHIPQIRLPSGQCIPADCAQNDNLIMSHQQLITGIWHIIRYCRDFHIMQDNNTMMV